jgi:hypothetical protein
MVVLSIGRSGRSYRVSVESTGGIIKPVKESRETRFSEETKDDIINRVEYMVKVFNQVTSGKQTSDYAEGLLKKNGTVIYRKVIPEDFSDILSAKYLLLEVEDTDIPWELMYSDTFFALKYGISRRIVTTDKVNVRQKKTRGRRALVISNPKKDLQGADTECEIIYRRLAQKMKTILVKRGDATKERIAHLLGQGFDIIHFAGHVKDGLILSNGTMTPGEVKEFMTGTPVVFVNGCKSEDLAKAFLLGGTMAYIGMIHPIHDTSAADIAADFYDLCLQYQIGEALRRAREIYVEENLVWASLIMYGDPTLKLL